MSAVYVHDYCISSAHDVRATIAVPQLSAANYIAPRHPRHTKSSTKLWALNSTDSINHCSCDGPNRLKPLRYPCLLQPEAVVAYILDAKIWTVINSDPAVTGEPMEQVGFRNFNQE